MELETLLHRLRDEPAPRARVMVLIDGIQSAIAAAAHNKDWSEVTALTDLLVARGVELVATVMGDEPSVAQNETFDEEENARRRDATREEIAERERVAAQDRDATRARSAGASPTMSTHDTAPVRSSPQPATTPSGAVTTPTTPDSRGPDGSPVLHSAQTTTPRDPKDGDEARSDTSRPASGSGNDNKRK